MCVLCVLYVCIVYVSMCVLCMCLCVYCVCVCVYCVCICVYCMCVLYVYVCVYMPTLALIIPSCKLTDKLHPLLVCEVVNSRAERNPREVKDVFAKGEEGGEAAADSVTGVR